MNLRKLLGRKPTQSEKTEFAQKAVETITLRTLDGEDVNGRNFTRYSKEYANTKGVTRDSVDLFLTGATLDSIDLQSQTRDTVTFGIEGGFSAEKSEWHNKGKGHNPVREFFGLTTKEAEDIAKDIEGPSTPDRRISLGELQAALSVLDIEQEE